MCVELVSLSHALLGDHQECLVEANELQGVAVSVLNAVIENSRDTDNLSVDASTFRGFKSVKRAKDAGAIEATLIGVFSRTLSAIATKYDRLYHLRNIGTPPAIRAIVYVLGVVNVVQYVMSMNGEDDTTRVAVGAFVSSATIGVLATSAATRDPLDSAGLSGSLKKSVKSTIKQVQELRIGSRLTEVSGVNSSSTAGLFSSLYLRL